MKFVVICKVMDKDLVVDEWTATHDIQSPPTGNMKGLLARLRVLIRRELIARNLITPEPEDAVRKR